MIQFSDTEGAVNLSQIEEVENLVALTFPKEYKAHLLNHNGGRCSPNIFSFYENGEKTESRVEWFLAIYAGEYDNLNEYIDIYKISENRLPLNMLPIAHDPGGNLICISCGKKDIGKVYFWDHEKEVDYDIASQDNYSNLYLIADTFNDFLAGLRTKA